MLSKIVAFWDYLYELVLYPTPSMGTGYVIGSVLLVTFLMLYLWHEHRLRAGKLLLLSTLLLPFCAALAVLSIRGVHGVPDTRCHLYANGTQAYELLAFPTAMAANPAKPLESALLTLQVRAKDRWGTAPHLCVLPLDHPKARAFLATLSRTPEAETMGRIRTWDYPMFSFGGIAHDPNFQWQREPGKATPEKGTPDKPPREFES